MSRRDTIEPRTSPYATGRAGLRAAGVALGLAVAGSLFSTEPLTAQDAPPAPSTAGEPRGQQQLAAAIDGLEPDDRSWVRSVIGLITNVELEYFLSLDEDYRREAFKEKFWEPRDLDRSTPQNELKARWEEVRASSADASFGDPRAMLYLLNGPPGGYALPNGRPIDRCFARGRELEIWFYGASELNGRRFLVILQKVAPERPYEPYLPGGRLRPMQRSGGLPTTNVRQLCGDELLRGAVAETSRIGRYNLLLEEVLTPPLPSEEWLAGIAAGATDLPPGAETFEVSTEIDFPERRQSRTGVRVVLGVPRAEAPGRRFDGELFHNFSLRGEVIRDGSLLERFAYGFSGPTPEDSERLPIGFTRYIRPGPATVRLVVEDLYSGKLAQVVRELEVPSPEGLPAAASAAPAERPAGPRLELLAPPGDVVLGPIRFTARAVGEFDKVTFYLDGEPVISKRRPPFSVELNLGEAAEPRRVRVVGFAGEREIATDQIWLNQGALRPRVRIIEPRPGGIYPGGTRVRLELDTPAGQEAERVELRVDDELVSEIEGPPYDGVLRLPSGRPAVVTAVALLADGSRAEDSVLVNSAGVNEVVEVRLVEVYALVLDSAGQAVRGLREESFRVYENGVERPVRRFVESERTPLHAVFLLDSSASMEGRLEEVRAATLELANQLSRTEGDRVSVLSFAEALAADVERAARRADVERALAGIRAGGRTALYDALTQTLNRYQSEAGQTVVVLFTDGADDGSRLDLDSVMATAKGSPVTLYAVGLGADFASRADRRRLQDLVATSGGRAFFIEGLASLPAVYADIAGDLRSRYLLAFEPAPGGGEFRELSVEVDAEGVEVRARDGYRP